MNICIQELNNIINNLRLNENNIINFFYYYIKQQKCEHNYIIDYVDIDIERGGAYIRYCEICEHCDKNFILKLSN